MVQTTLGSGKILVSCNGPVTTIVINRPERLNAMDAEVVSLEEAEVNAARHRAHLLGAAGGDPHRELGIDDRAVKALAADLYTEERREQLARAVDALVLRVRELPVTREAAIFLAGDVDLAWRLFSLALLAEELDE